jgi:hypothetical protein
MSNSAFQADTVMRASQACPRFLADKDARSSTEQAGMLVLPSGPTAEAAEWDEASVSAELSGPV